LRGENLAFITALKGAEPFNENQINLDVSSLKTAKISIQIM